MELQATSLVFGINIVLHQAGQVRWNSCSLLSGRTVWSPCTQHLPRGNCPVPDIALRAAASVEHHELSKSEPDTSLTHLFETFCHSLENYDCFTAPCPPERSSLQGRTLHLSYHDGEHYNSVRLADDFNPGAATPIPEAAPASIAATSRKVCGGAKELAV